MKQTISVHRTSGKKSGNALNSEVSTLRFDAEKRGWAVVGSFYTTSACELSAPEVGALLALMRATDASDVILAHIDRLRRVNERDFIRMVAVIEQACIAVHVRIGA